MAPLDLMNTIMLKCFGLFCLLLALFSDMQATIWFVVA